jgi:hypothetical protein
VIPFQTTGEFIISACFCREWIYPFEVWPSPCRLFDLARTCNEDLEGCECATAENLIDEGIIRCATEDERFTNPPACPYECPICEVRRDASIRSFLSFVFLSCEGLIFFIFLSSAWLLLDAKIFTMWIFRERMFWSRRSPAIFRIAFSLLVSIVFWKGSCHPFVSQYVGLLSQNASHDFRKSQDNQPTLAQIGPTSELFLSSHFSGMS